MPSRRKVNAVVLSTLGGLLLVCVVCAFVIGISDPDRPAGSEQASAVPTSAGHSAPMSKAKPQVKPTISRALKSSLQPLKPVTRTSKAQPPPPPPAEHLDPRFRTCKEAIAHGYGPYRKDVDPEYYWYRDGDKDG